MLRTLSCALTLALALPAQDGIVGQVAPQLGELDWAHLPAGQRYEPAEQRGRVQVLFFFQTDCPSCHRKGLPLLKALVDHFKGREDVRFAAVQTVFHGAARNTQTAAQKLFSKHGLKVPLARDIGAKPGDATPIMIRYDSPGTPWFVTIDRQGVVRQNSFGMKVQAKDAIAYLEGLCKERGIVGSPFGAFTGVQAAGALPDFSKNRFTLIRWWTNTCPHCAASLPALEELRGKVKGFEVLAMYHPKPVRKVGIDRVVAEARRLGFEGPVAQDPAWGLFRQLRARGVPGRATSISVLVDRKGIIRWVHPGPRIHPSDDPRHRAAAQSYEELRRTVDF